MFPTELRYQLRDAAYARLYASEKLSVGLRKANDPAHQRIILQEILDNGQKNLDQMAHRGDPYLMSSTYLMMAKASFDCSILASSLGEKENLLHRALDFADLAAETALESEYSVVPLLILPELLIVLTRAHQEVSPGGGQPSATQQRLVQNRLRTVVQAFVDAEERQRGDRRQAAQDLFVVQLLAESAYWLDEREDQKKVLQKAKEQAELTLQKARGAGDPDLTRQVQHTLIDIERGLKY